MIRRLASVVVMFFGTVAAPSLAATAEPGTEAATHPGKPESIESLFSPGGVRATGAVLMLDRRDAPSPELARDMPEMLRTLGGVSALLDQRGLGTLRSAIGAPVGRGHSSPVGDPVWRLHLFSKTGHAGAEILRTGDGGFVLRLSSGDGAGPAQERVLLGPRFAEASEHWPQFPGPFFGSAPSITGGVIFELPKPYVASTIHIDTATIRARILGGGSTQLAGTTRDLTTETFWVRLPREYSVRSPAGLLVWISAMPEGKPPTVFNDALDALNIICIGAGNSGNERPVVDRYQLALDAIINAQVRFHLDPERVYVSGISGGGRVSSLLCACFPDVFTGCVPIVGMSSYHDAPAPNGKRYPSAYVRPGGHLGELLRQRRIAAISGEKDFNHLEITAYCMQHKDDGLPVRLFDYPDMGHTLPTATRFREAIEWVDEPVRTQRSQAREAAEREWAAVIGKFGDKPAAIPAHRSALEHVLAVGPWTVPAWKAAECLGVAPKRESSGRSEEPSDQ